MMPWSREEIGKTDQALDLFCGENWEDFGELDVLWNSIYWSLIFPYVCTFLLYTQGEKYLS